MRIALFSVAFAVLTITSFAQPRAEMWADSVLATLSLEEKIGQLFMVAAYSNKGKAHEETLARLIEEYHIGGLIFFQGGPKRQLNMMENLQSKSTIPLMIGIDAEWGLNMRLDSTIHFPYAMTLGAIQNEKLIEEFGYVLGEQCKDLGIHVNFAPVADVNNNSLNPVINYRSFGESRENVSRMANAFVHGIQSAGVMACAKHFPGHGNTDADSHKTLPTVSSSRNELDSIELYPFRALFRDSLASVMVAHLNVPSLEDENIPTTLSEKVVTGLLKEKLDYDGLIFTDALNMGGVTEYFKPGDIEVMALQAGNDVLLFPEDVPEAVKKIRRAIRRNNLEEERVNNSVKKILTAKYEAGLHPYQHPNKDNIYSRLNSAHARHIREKLYQSAITAIGNTDILPFKKLDTLQIATVSIGADSKTDFQHYVGYYGPAIHYVLPFNADQNQKVELLNDLNQFNTVLISLHGSTQRRANNYGIDPGIVDLINQIAQRKQVVISLFANPYSGHFLPAQLPTLIAYEDVEITQKAAAQLIFGGLEASGKLPVSIHNEWKAGEGDLVIPNGRLGFATPETVEMDAGMLNQIDLLAEEAIKSGATPGCQIWVARAGKVVYKKNFGHYTWDSMQTVTDESVYDLASITKVAATLQTVMFLEERNLIDLDRRIMSYLPELRRSNKRNMDLRHILSHQAGLKPYIPFYQYTLDNNRYPDTVHYYREFPSFPFDQMVIPGFYVSNTIADSIWGWTVESKLLDKPLFKSYPYVYSDMGYYLTHRIAENLLNQPIEEFLDQNFYRPLGMNFTAFNPLCRFPEGQIVPTEIDDYFRYTTVRGTVHDQGAALYGGVAGHAGLFSNASDMVKLMQMNMQDGIYGGEQYFLPGTIYTFSQKQWENNRRGIGWDRPNLKPGTGPTSSYASYKSFGHTGFTGTIAWADPAFNLVYVFLSNRTYPNSGNRKLIYLNIRTRIQDIIYKSIFEFEKYTL